jgi:hypothetical protein
VNKISVALAAAILRGRFLSKSAGVSREVMMSVHNAYIILFMLNKHAKITLRQPVAIHALVIMLSELGVHRLECMLVVTL